MKLYLKRDRFILWGLAALVVVRLCYYLLPTTLHGNWVIPGYCSWPDGHHQFLRFSGGSVIAYDEAESRAMLVGTYERIGRHQFGLDEHSCRLHETGTIFVPVAEPMEIQAGWARLIMNDPYALTGYRDWRFLKAAGIRKKQDRLPLLRIEDLIRRDNERLAERMDSPTTP